MGGLEQNKKQYKHTYDAVKVSAEMKERLLNMRNPEVSKKQAQTEKSVWVQALPRSGSTGLMGC